MGAHPNFPQAPRNRTVALSGPLRLPRIEPLSALCIQGKAMEICASRAVDSSAASLDRFCAALDGAGELTADFPGLHDELAPFLDDRFKRTAESAVKLRAEFNVYRRMYERARDLERLSPDGFVRLLLEIHRRLGTGANGFRTGPVLIRPDRAGNKVLFPHHSECAALIAMLHGFLHRHLRHHPALCATVAYAAVIHAHPFVDGNGRTARTLCNLVLAAGAGSRHFVPVHLVASLDQASFLIRLRRALYANDWPALQAFFGDALRLSDRLQRSPGSALPDELVSDGSSC